MKPLVSGPEAKRYEEPETDTYLLFPYERDARGAMRLIPADDMARALSEAWAHLRKMEEGIAQPENRRRSMTNRWYRFGRNQNIDKQDIPKLIVAQTVPEMRVIR